MRWEIFPVVDKEVGEAYQLAVDLIGPNIAHPETLRRVHEQTGAGLFVAREHGALSGVLALILLNQAGLRAVRADSLDGLDPSPAQIIRRGEEPSALYAWGMAATSLRTAQRLIQGYIGIDRVAVPHLDCYGRPATRAGERLMTGRLGFKPLRRSTTGVVCRTPITHVEAAAA
ncbi:MAG TPA: hypothetical protein VE309_01190 [Caulobacteraceae bacterium]|nr:hypothetical protein [Caulobacteraceae bacterium]